MVFSCMHTMPYGSPECRPGEKEYVFFRTMMYYVYRLIGVNEKSGSDTIRFPA